MHKWRASLREIISGVVPILCWLLYMVSAQAGVISPDLERAVARRGTHADTSVIIRFVDSVDMTPLAVVNRQARDNRLLLALKASAANHRSEVDSLLVEQGAKNIRDLWLINAVSAIVPAMALKQLAAHAGIARIDLDSFVQGGRSQRTPKSRTQPGNVSATTELVAVMKDDASVLMLPSSTANKPGWNINAVQAPQLWAQGITGKGVVVATMDTGVDLAHPDLRRKWRGGTNSWFDPHGEEASPYDALGHGTQALGVMVGGSGIGVAPDAQWIAVRLYNGDGKASMSDIHLAFQWLMDPDGDPATADAPDVVNASWSLSGRSTGKCVLEFNDDLNALRSAGIMVVFAAGNDGPRPGSSNSPGNNPGVMSVGAVGCDLSMARQTSRGPSACDGGAFPRMVAPGVEIRTTDLSHGGQASYTTVSGSSLAAPHVAGVLALMAGAFPSASVVELESALLLGSQSLIEMHSGDLTVPGRVDALAAFKVFRDARDPATLTLKR